MKILWIVNTPLNILGEKLYGKREEGAWMGALLADFIENQNTTLLIATTARVKQTQKWVEQGVTYYALPDAPPLLYNENKPSNLAAWKTLFETERPDLIQLWGSEFVHGLCALRAAGTAFPSVIYMQGFLASVAKHYLAGMTYREIKKNITLRDRLKHDNLFQQQQKYYTAAKKEAELLRLSGRIISETEWCNTNVRAIVPSIQIYSCPLSINHAFEHSCWTLESVRPHSIICNASGYPLKGLHMIVRAVAILKSKYPDIQLYVPGKKPISDGSFQWKLRKRGYTKYLERLIRDLDVADQIVWLGKLSQEELAAQYAKSHVFVLGSSIENHSSSLKEAMMVGTPCVASAVGGIPEFVHHGKNGFLYRFKEYEVMAEYISRIFDDDALAKELSTAGRKDMLQLHANANVSNQIFEIYQCMLQNR